MFKPGRTDFLSYSPVAEFGALAELDPNALAHLLADSPSRTGAPRQLAVPRPGCIPRFDDVFQIARLRVMFDLRVAVLAMSPEILLAWQSRLNAHPIPAPGLDLLDAYAAPPSEWKSYFCRHGYDAVILHGVLSGLSSHALALDRVCEYVSAVPSGLIILA